MKYLIAIDSDGTIRHSDGTISTRTKKVIKELIKKDNIIVICTARPRYHTLEISKKAGIEEYLISSNGTEVFYNNKVIYSAYLTKSKCKKIYEDAVKNDIRVMFVTDNTEYVTQFTRNDSQVLLDDTNVDTLLSKKVKQIMIIGKNKEKIKAYKKVINDKYKLNIIDSSNEEKEEIWFSIISNKASKGIALEKLAEYLNIPMKNTIAIGNDKNDASMLKKAGLSVAVGNATTSIKKEVDYVTLSNDEDGVAAFLETLL